MKLPLMDKTKGQNMLLHVKTDYWTIHLVTIWLVMILAILIQALWRQVRLVRRQSQRECALLLTRSTDMHIINFANLPFTPCTRRVLGWRTLNFASVYLLVPMRWRDSFGIHHTSTGSNFLTFISLNGTTTDISNSAIFFTTTWGRRWASLKKPTTLCMLGGPRCT